ncbi:MAG: MaoC family dehydratase [Acidobacteria bacterium]|nr:MaoC family dehydratase [Acidobacteriota bacterium]
MIEIIAHNYGADHANAIHNDAGARQHGFAGALVPGVAVYGYLMRPAVEAWGLDWLAHGAASVRFLHPVYDGERMIAEADDTMNLQLRNAAQTVCAQGAASLSEELPELSSTDYELAETCLRPPTIASFQVGEPLGSWAFTLNWQVERAAFLADMNDDAALYQRAPHPAYWLARANEMFMSNIALGMWIHTASEIQHYALPVEGEAISLRGRVIELYEKKGHEYLAADLAAFGEHERPLVQIKHTAIIRLNEPR